MLAFIVETMDVSDELRNGTRDSSTLMNHMCIIQGVFKQKHLSHKVAVFFFLSIYLFLLQHLVFNAASKGSFVAVCECLVEACEAS